MEPCRSGTSLCEVLLALVLLSTSAAWALQAAAATERALGESQIRASATQRAIRALAELHALPCDSAAATRGFTEPRWRLQAVRTTSGANRLDVVTLHSRRGDTIRIADHLWCSR